MRPSSLYAGNGEIRHLLLAGRTKKFGWYPVPDPDWQAREYEALMQGPPPENQDTWQFAYTGRTKADKEAFADFIAA